MLNILNRLAWGLSLCLGLLVTNIISQDGFFIDGLFYFLFLGFFTFIFKRIFFSMHYIQGALDGKYEQLNRSYLENEKSVPVHEDVAKEVANEVPMKEEVVQKSDDDGKSVADKAADFAEKMILGSVLEADKKESEEKDLPYERRDNGVMANELSGQAKEKEIERQSVFSSFFKENALAKVGGILLFLAVLFLMQLVYTRIGPMGKLMLGFAFGFLTFGVGLLLERKNFKKESRVLMGAAILINYLVILSGRYLIGEGLLEKQLLLNESITFFLLVVNTIFAVTVAMAYESRSILVFSFFAAYLNPFLIGEKMSLTVYTIVAYSLFVSLGALFLSSHYKKNASNLSDAFLGIAFIGGNILAIAAPFDNVWQWLIKLALLALVSFACSFFAYRYKDNMAVFRILAGTYIFFYLLVTFGSYRTGIDINGVAATLGIMTFFLLALLASLYFIATKIFYPIFSLLFVPLGLILAFYGTDMLGLSSLAYVLSGSLVFYLMIFASFAEKINKSVSQVFFLLLAFFIVSMSIIWDLEKLYFADFGFIQSYGIALATLIFLFSSYYFSKREGLGPLYSIGTLASVFILPMIVEWKGEFRLASMIISMLFVAANLVWPLINKRLLRESSNLIFSILIASLYAVFEVFQYWNGASNMSKVSLGLSFMALAIIYFGFAYMALRSLSGKALAEEQKDAKEVISSSIYPLIGISISLFSLAIAYVFSKHSEVVALVLLFESTVLYYFYSLKRSVMIYWGGVVLMVIGVIKLIYLAAATSADFKMIIPVAMMMASFAQSLKFLEFEKRNIRFIHDFGHIMGMIIINSLVLKIFDINDQAWVLFSMSLFLLVLTLIYSTIYSGLIKWFYLVALNIFLFVHMASVSSIFSYENRENIELIKLFQYLSTAIVLISAYAFNFLSKLWNRKELVDGMLVFAVNMFVSIYAFIISTQYVFYFFSEKEFVITIYWGIISLVLLSYGIHKDIVKLRTIGLYILSLTVLKILIFDIWSGLDDAMLRVIALMVVGAIMISVSILYSKKYGGDLKGEFSFENIKSIK